jgi:hypothetical protein
MRNILADPMILLNAVSKLVIALKKKNMPLPTSAVFFSALIGHPQDHNPDDRSNGKARMEIEHAAQIIEVNVELSKPRLMTLEAIPKSFFYDNYIIVIYYGLHHIFVGFYFLSSHCTSRRFWI